MAELMAGLPVLPLTFGCQMKFEAINPLTGAQVTGVTVSQAVIYGIVPTSGSSLLDELPRLTPLELAGGF